METIARIASPHLSGDNYAEAIHKALMLLTYAEQAIQEEIDFQTISPMLSRCNERINYKRGVREITGQTRPGRAVEYFQNFLATRLSKERAHLPQDKRRLELVRQLDEYETSGFNGGDLESLREEFKFSRMQRNKKRRHRKKIL